MKAVIYARYSSDNQREESIEGQIRECTAFAEKNGITILRHYIDRAFSAKTDNRPEFQNMIKDSGKRLFDMIIVWKLDRFARNRYDSARYKAALKKNGVKVVSATEVISDGAEGIILESVLEGYAEYYSADLSEKVVRGMTENALKSKYNGGTLPIGYQIDSDQCFQLDPLTAPFVHEAFQRYDEGATMTQIRDWLNEQGVKNTRGQKMTYNSIQHLLNNRRYIGEYTYRDIVVPDGIPAIVPQDLFDRVQEKLAKNKKAPARHKAEDDYLLTTKLFCGYCGAYLCGESGTSHTGNVHHYYKCVSVKKKRTECHKKSVRKEWIEDLVVNETMKMVMDDTAIEAIVSILMDLQDRENVNLPLYEQQLRETDTAIQNLLNAIQQGILTKSTKGRLEELEATKEELEAKIACEKLAKPKVSAEFMTFWLHRFRKLDVRQKSHCKMLIDTFINAIFLYDDKLVITFNYKDGTDTITFDDLKAALDKENTGSDLDCSTAPKKEDTLFSVSSFLSLRRRLHMLTFPCPVAVDSACAEVLPNTCRHTGAVMRFGGSVPGSGHMGPPFRRKRPMRLWLPSQEDSGDLSEYEACFCNSYTGHGDGDLSPWPVLLHRSYSSSKRRRPAISQTGREKTRDWAAVCMPAWVITAFMISRRSSAFTRINTSSRSAAMETPKNLWAKSVPVPFAWTEVPPVAPALRAAAITWSVWPWFVMTINSSCVDLLSIVSGSSCRNK